MFEAETGGRLAIDRDHHLLAEILLIRRDVGEIGLLLQFAEKLVGPQAKLRLVQILENVLVLRARQPALDLDVLHRLQMQR